MEVNKVYCGDCQDILKTLPENLVDSIVTDPPYELGFMGKSWDNTGIANNPEMWAECLRVLKPGGHLLSFGGTRTYHRMAVAIEDAGFEVRDMINWIYSTGFPKSLNIGKAVDKLQGNEREDLGESENNRDRSKHEYNSVGNVGSNARLTKGTSEWEGWGTALKPSHEPICMARKPLTEKTVAQNVLKYGTGGINIDEIRVWTEDKMSYSSSEKQGVTQFGTGTTEQSPLGRFPANLIHDNSEEVRECFPETGKSTGGRIGNKGSALNMMGQDYEAGDPGYGDSGNASRFFKSIKQDLHCSLCYDTIEAYQLTKNICNNTNVNNVEKSSETTQAITEDTAQLNATQKAKISLVQNVKSAGNLCDLCGTFIAHEIVGQKIAQSLGLIPGQVTITEPNLQILKKCLASFVELRGNTDTIPTMESLNLLFGYVFNAIENSTQNYEDTKSRDKNYYRSLAYYPKASKSERNKGCEELEPKEWIDGACLANRDIRPNEPNKNNHPTVKPIALMEYLIKMVTPKGGIVLDPFAGSGSTLVAAKNNGFNYIGIEMTEEYIPIIEARLSSVENTLFI